MTLEEVRALTDKEVVERSWPHPFVGGHRISTNWHDLWFSFRDGGLEAVTFGGVENSKSTRLSPRQNLCTGELAFYLDVTWPVDLIGASVYLDGELVADTVRTCPPLLLSSKEHEVRIEKPGYEAIIKSFRLTSSDRGDQTLDLTAADIRPR